ncbi:AraC family transcriptional regulator [Capsulimonas corticalis]|uniref:AraC family transcriptional regulator n=1 Tax=Capsulimonas corticalis TaxID=2219043 RepID=A0A402D1F1_9BACT|nr:AraC family transcriptional regulator [Capsulimonas corticalis]BDI31627.1 AraC family transcriptional regulator [Capsulimonas corticalis]
MMDICQLNFSLPVQAINAGLFVSSGKGTHPDRVFPYFDLIYVRSGVLDIQEAEKAFHVAAGETLLLWPERRHFGTKIYPADLSYFWLHFLIRETPESAGRQSCDVAQHASVSRPDQLAEAFRRFLDDQESGSLEQMTADLLVTLILREAARSHEATGAARHSSISAANRANAYIIAHFHEPITVAEVAEKVGCNPNYLARIFREAYGKTMTDAVHDCRLAYARRLLIEGYQNVDEIARECGFADGGYFRRLFKRAHAMTPLAFRNLYARVHVNSA